MVIELDYVFENQCSREITEQTTGKQEYECGVLLV